MPEQAPEQQTGRPRRQRILDALGLPKTLPASAQDFLPLGPARPGQQDVLLLGLGPEPERLAELLPALRNSSRVAFIEAPELSAQLGEDWRARIPAHWHELPPTEASACAQTARVLLYRPGPRLFPDFWGPLLARLQAAFLPQDLAQAVDKDLVWLPGGEADLLRRELREAFESLGFRVRQLPDETAVRDLLAGGERPALYFSVNFRGLDPLGQAAHLLEAAGATVAVWCVDNPLHLLSGLKARFWTRLPLFVTDDWFLAPLRKLGATNVRHLPLAARALDVTGPARAPAPAFADLAQRLAFVGRSAFPGKADFFAGCALPAAAWTEAEHLLAQGGRADFGWWLTRLGIEKLWPGTEARRAGFCTEETGKAWRTACLRRAQKDLAGELTVFGPLEGEDGWRGLLPEGTDLRGPVDYYAALPDLCASAGACLNCTSPLLPHGLTQRHFDVWAWGGLLLTDATPGLSLFPADLTREISFRRPEDIAPRLRELLASDTAGLKQAWRAELAARHTYAHRVRTVLEAVGLA
ncbi:MAG TPA: glycosyltransferase [Humidesulfovibrio sp.]|uniref:glycosyltransferase family protein n=1 Tax=Humidesulfovibrio sp. TaxID=2910988 RepID=UPI002C5AF4D7|nr:glycosyltransferase [Humidesulfovibrio sp.]HWR03311.1 glycosyltransferase [Humidesulfovibrio sp.]